MRSSNRCSGGLSGIDCLLARPRAGGSGGPEMLGGVGAPRTPVLGAGEQFGGGGPYPVGGGDRGQRAQALDRLLEAPARTKQPRIGGDGAGHGGEGGGSAARHPDQDRVGL